MFEKNYCKKLFIYCNWEKNQKVDKIVFVKFNDSIFSTKNDNWKLCFWSSCEKTARTKKKLGSGTNMVFNNSCKHFQKFHNFLKSEYIFRVGIFWPKMGSRKDFTFSWPQTGLNPNYLFRPIWGQGRFTFSWP